MRSVPFVIALFLFMCLEEPAPLSTDFLDESFANSLQSPPVVHGTGRAAGGTFSAEETVVRSYLKEAIREEGLDWGDDCVGSAAELCWNESRFNPYCQNPASSAYGLYQFLDETRADYGLAMDASPYGQTRAFVRYVSDRYGCPCDALAFWNVEHEVDGRMVNFY